MREFGRPITFDQAQELATSLLRLYKTILGPVGSRESHGQDNR